MGEDTRKDRTPLPYKLANGNAKWVALVITALLGTGGGATWLSMGPDKADATIERMQVELDSYREKRLGGIEQRLEKIEVGQGRVWRALGKIGAKLKVKDMEDEE